ncbi:MAG: oligosaccharide flippase family protein [Afipia sp.]|nr:oligosaccharide flippase family protein [Afipia sp.]
MLEIKRLAGRSVVYGLGQVASQSAALLALPLVTRYLAPEAYGIIGLTTIMCVLLRIVFGLASSAAIGVEYFKNADSEWRRKVVVAQMAIALVSSVCLLVAGLSLAPLLSRWVLGASSPDGELAIRLSLVTLAFQILYEPLLLKLQFEEKAKKFVTFTVLASIGGVCLSLLLVIVGGLGVVGWLAGQLAAAVALCLLINVFECPRNFSAGGIRKVATTILALSGPIVPGVLAIFILQRSGPYFVSREFGLGDTGVFTVGYQLGMGMALATSAFSIAWMPFFQGFVSKQEESLTVFENIATIYIAVFGTMTLLFFAASKLLIFIFAGVKFQDAWQVIGPIALGQFFLGFWGLLLPGMYFTRRTGTVSIVQIIAAIAILAASPAIVAAFGPLGAALLQAAGFAMLLALQAVLNWWLDVPARYVKWPAILSLLAIPAASALIHDLVSRLPLIEGLAWASMVAGLFAVGTGAVAWINWHRTKNESSVPALGSLENNSGQLKI